MSRRDASFQLKVHLFDKKSPRFVSMEKSSATPQKLIEKLIGQLSSSACNVWVVKNDGSGKKRKRERMLYESRNRFQ